MTKAKLQSMSNYFLKRFFGGIPKIDTEFKEFEFSEEIGYFILEENDDYDISEEDAVYAELLKEAPEYRINDRMEEGLTILENDTPIYTDPACHPRISIHINDRIKRNNLVVVGTLLHELTHYYCWYVGLDYHDGNREFENKLKELGFPSNFDRKFNKESKKWEDNFNYASLQKYVDEFENGV